MITPPDGAVFSVRPQVKAARLCVVGLGPGDAALLPAMAAAALDSSTVIAGYKGYIELLPPDCLAGKEVIATGMTREMDRANAALDSALSGKATSLVCSGDPGVYALAGLVLELMEQRGLCATDLPLEIVPGIPAVCAAAALLGAPLMHDFACVSLSDLLTPWALIQKRLEMAFAGDFIVALYNPRSKRRTSQLEEARQSALRHRAPSTPTGIVRNAFRKDMRADIVALADLDPAAADMFSILIIGNNDTRIVPGRGDKPLAWENGARMLTPRGYMDKYGHAEKQPGE
jgi:precorrin-3B C17-methyltransferase